MLELDKSIEKMESMRTIKRDGVSPQRKDNEILFVVAKAAMQVLAQFEGTEAIQVKGENGTEFEVDLWGDFLDIMAHEGFGTKTVISFERAAS